MIIYKTNWGKRFETAPVIKKWDWDKSLGILTRSALRDLLFNDDKPKSDFIEVK